MPPFTFLPALLSLRLLMLACLCAGLFSAEDSPDNVTVTATDPRLIYNGTWTDSGTWNDPSGVHRFSSEKDCSVSLLFNGTAVYWHSDIDPRGAIGRVTLDGGRSTLVDIGANATEVMNTTISAVMFARDGLDAGHEHNITIAWADIGKFNGTFLTLYSFEYTPLAISGSSTAVPSATAKPSTGGDGSKDTNVGGIAGGVIAGVVAGALLVLLGICVRRRRQRTRQRKNAATQARASRPYHLPPALPLRAVSEPEDKYSFSPASAYSAPIFAAEAPGLSTSIVPGASTVARSTALDRSAPVAAPQLHAPEAAAQGTPQPHMLDSSRFPISVAPAPPASLREPAAVDGSAGGQVSRTVDVLQPTLGSVGAEPRVSSYDADGPPPMYRP